MTTLSKRPASPELRDGERLGFLDRTAELCRLRDALVKRESLLLCGPPGIGKTALLLEVLCQLDADLARRCFYLSGVEGLQNLLRHLLTHLFEARDDALRRQLHREGIQGGAFKAWLQAQSTSRLKGAAYRAFETTPYWVFLDHMARFTHAVAKVVKELVRMRNTPVYLLARGFSELDVGHLAGLYWSDRQRVVLGPLPELEAHRLLESCVERFGLAHLDLEGFREEVLRLSGQVPGAMVKMCSLASNPRYQYGSQIKTKLIHIDTLVSGYNADLERTKQG